MAFHHDRRRRSRRIKRCVEVDSRHHLFNLSSIHLLDALSSASTRKLQSILVNDTKPLSRRIVRRTRKTTSYFVDPTTPKGIVPSPASCRPLADPLSRRAAWPKYSVRPRPRQVIVIIITAPLLFPSIATGARFLLEDPPLHAEPTSEINL